MKLHSDRILLFATPVLTQFIYPDAAPNMPSPIEALEEAPVWVVGTTYNIQWNSSFQSVGMNLWPCNARRFTRVFTDIPDSGSYWWTVTFRDGEGMLDQEFGNLFFLELYEAGSIYPTFASTYINITSPSAPSATVAMSSTSTTSPTSWSIVSMESTLATFAPALFAASSFTSAPFTSSTSVRTFSKSSSETSFETSSFTTPPAPMLWSTSIRSSSQHSLAFTTSTLSSSMTISVGTQEISTLFHTASATIVAPANSSLITTSTRTQTIKVGLGVGIGIGLPASFIIGTMVALIIQTYLKNKKRKARAHVSYIQTLHEMYGDPALPSRRCTSINSALVGPRISRFEWEAHYGEVPQGRAEVDGAPLTKSLVFVLKDTLE